MTDFSKAAVISSRALSQLLVGGLLLGSVVGLAAYLLGHEQVLSVQTASMVPTFRPGDAVLLRSVNPVELRPGDIISYRNSRNAAMIITHRLVNIDTRTGQFTTQGDNSSVADPSFPAQQLIGRVTAVAPSLGLALDHIHTPVGLATVVYLPAALIIGAEARRVLKQSGYQPYRARLR